MRRTTATLTAAVALLMASWLSACGGEGEADAYEPLKIGYQRFGGLSLVKAKEAAPDAEWSLFESGPALTEALKAGAIDIGQTGEAPPIFAAAGKTDFRIVATSAPVPKGEAVLVKEKSGFTSFTDLKGKTVALNKGSNVNWLLVKLLEANDMTIDDIDVKYLKPAEARPAFDNDQVDAWIIWDPYFALAEQPGVKVLVDATGLAHNREYVLVTPEALEEKPEKVEAFLKEYREVTDWGIAHPQERATLLAPELKIPLDTTTRALERSAQPLAALTPEIAAELQEIADGFADLELIPEPVDIAGRVDDRYSDILE
ncbi:aliphatic sulfonate ABC transporter substrate-binding protein [Mumia quercus]|uniref:aliphatic sulfonate ABC transporter substrate-binding protein n=1 Tax=Mumia quercus TaxID=2976125 RepID=UPI0021D16461|nr:aliphatic sulfonate ABC transporter substrate-binding protein [Mumia quercus]